MVLLPIYVIKNMAVAACGPGNVHSSGALDFTLGFVMFGVLLTSPLIYSILRAWTSSIDHVDYWFVWSSVFSLFFHTARSNI